MLLNLHDVDIKLLRVFQVVAKYKGITAAQGVLNSAQPTISMQLAQLEARLGMVLCQRGQAGFKLTSEGQAVLTASEKLFAAIEGFKLDLTDLSSSPRGELKFGVIDNLSTHPQFDLHLLISDFREQVPNVDLQIIVESSMELEQMVMEGSLQFCIGVCDRRLASFNYIPLFTEKHRLYCASNHELSGIEVLKAEDIAQHLYVDWEYNEPRESKLRGVDFESGASTPYLEAIYWLLASGKYIGYLPDHFAAQWVQKGMIIELDLEDDIRSMEVYIMTKKGIKHPSPVNVFIEMLEKRYRVTPH